MATPLLSSERSCSSSSIPLPEDLVIAILSCLPVASLLRFKSVCKSWYHLIGSSAFIHHHLARHRHPLMDTNYSLFIMDRNLTFEDPYFHLHLLSCHNCVFSKNIHLPNLAKIVYPMSMLSWNGIICFCYLWDKNVYPFQLRHRYPDDEYFVHVSLCNPSTKQVRILPCPVLPAPQRHISSWELSFGFGFDILTNAYKLVVIFIYYATSDGEKSWSQVQVYSLNTNSWKTIDGVFPIDCVKSIFSGVKAPSMDGAYYWMATTKSEHKDHPLLFNRIIISFDFSMEKFKTIPLPDDFSVKRDPYPVCAILNGNIACINKVARSSDGATADTSRLKHLEIWVLDECGTAESWTKLYTIGPFLASIPQGILKNRFLLLAESKKFCTYDIITGESKKIAAREENYRFHDHQSMMIVIYEESLVSINERDGALDGATPKDVSDWYSWLPKWIMLSGIESQSWRRWFW